MLRVFEAFSGVGSQRMALRNIGLPHKVVSISEIDKFAIKSYEEIHGKTNNVGNISTVDTSRLPEFDLFTYSFPCQDISNAGLERGFEKGSGTRSSLLWECERIIRDKRPKYILLENVKALVNKKNKEHFDTWLKVLNDYGYTNYWQVINAKDCGIPQNRERVFVVSILGEHKPFIFPEKRKLELRLNNLLEDEVDEKFYLSKEQIERIGKSNYHTVMGRLQTKEYCDTLCARDYKDPKIIKVGNLMSKETRKDPNVGRVISPIGIASCLDSMQGGHRQPKIIQRARGFNKGNVHDITPSITTSSWEQNHAVIEDYRIRKLTPKECWRLMGFSDEDFIKASQVNSNSQLYKQAGNSIVVSVLEAIFKNLFFEQLEEQEKNINLRVKKNYAEKEVKCELYNDHHQNYKRYNIPKAQLVIADIPYNIGDNAYASNPEWYVGGDNKKGESDKANKAFFDTDHNFKIAEFMHFCSKMLKKEPKEKNQAPAMIVFHSWQQREMIIKYGKKYGFNKAYPLYFVKKSSPQALKVNMKIVGATEEATVLYRDKLPKFKNGKEKGMPEMIKNWFNWELDDRKKYPKIHPTQKPVKLLKRLIEIFTDAGDVVIDPCAGSGTTLRAAKELGRHSYGFEIKKDMCARANEEILTYDELQTDIFEFI